MPKQHIEKRKADYYGLVGDLSFDSVVAIEKEGFAVIDEGSESITLDLSQVQACSSAAMALLLSWLRFAKRRQKQLHFVHLPSALMAMIQRAELESVMGVRV